MRPVDVLAKRDLLHTLVTRDAMFRATAISRGGSRAQRRAETGSTDTARSQMVKRSRILNVWDR